jgi:hypothetical protein
VDRLLCSYLNAVCFNGGLKDSDGNEVSTRKVFIFDEVKQKSHFEFIAEFDPSIIAELAFYQGFHVNINLLYLLDLNKVLDGSGFL